MASKIKSIPVLLGSSASSFQERAEKNLMKKGIIDFCTQHKIAKAILKKAALG